MIELKFHQTHGIYYLYDYIPKRDSASGMQIPADIYEDIVKNHPENIAVSSEILEYKNLDKRMLELFTKELMQAIAELSKDFSEDKIGLLAIPSSKVGKTSAPIYSIRMIREWYEKGITKSEYKCDKEILDLSNLLTRAYNIDASHLCNGTSNDYQSDFPEIGAIKNKERPSYNVKKDSLLFNENVFPKDGTTFIILDDVTTKSTSMQSARDTLKEHGVNENNICLLSLSHTILWRNYKIRQ